MNSSRHLYIYTRGCGGLVLRSLILPLMAGALNKSTARAEQRLAQWRKTTKHAAPKKKKGSEWERASGCVIKKCTWKWENLQRLQFHHLSASKDEKITRQFECDFRDFHRALVCKACAHAHIHTRFIAGGTYLKPFDAALRRDKRKREDRARLFASNRDE